MEKKACFDLIYEKGIWSEGGTAPLSGPGSRAEIAQGCIDFIDQSTTDKTVLHAVDLGCGDLTWISKTKHFFWLEYVGVDICEKVIEKNREDYRGQERKKFYCEDLLEFQVPNTDLLIIRDVIFHMKQEEVLQLLEKIQGRYRRLMITSCHLDKNEGEPDGHFHFRPLNLRLPPFNKYISNIEKVIPEPVFNRDVLIIKGEHSVVPSNPEVSTRNVWAYWEGKKPSLIVILHDLMERFSKKGKGYKFNLLTRENCDQYVELPKYFDNLIPAHRADYLRVALVEKYGGIWLDSDIIVMEPLDSLFDILEYREGFVINESGAYLCNCLFGSRPGTTLMKTWRENIFKIIEKKQGHGIEWTGIGNQQLKLFSSHIGDRSPYYYRFSGKDDMYPINYDKASYFYKTEYHEALNWRRPFQPLIVLVNEVYRALADKSVEEIRNSKMCLNWFLDHAYENLK